MSGTLALDWLLGFGAYRGPHRDIGTRRHQRDARKAPVSRRSGCTPLNGRMFLPPLVESSETWYVDCAEADTLLTGTQVLSCLVFMDATPDPSWTISATGGSTVVVDVDTNDVLVNASFNGWFSVNALSGETFSLTWSGGPSGQVIIYDYTAATVETLGLSSSSPLTSSALPYTGRYIIFINVTEQPGDPPGGSTISATLSSSGAMSTNELTALYDLGTACPGWLNCGDACP